eukprot:4482631-Pleurochrysis_carterae.AAC.1
MNVQERSRRQLHGALHCNRDDLIQIGVRRGKDHQVLPRSECLLQRFLHRNWRDALTTAVDHLSQSAGQKEPAVSVHVSEVASSERIRNVPAAVSRPQVCAAEDADLARFAHWDDVGARRREDAHVDADGDADAARLVQRVAERRARNRHALGH